MKSARRWAAFLMMALLLISVGCDKDDPASPEDQRPDFENSEGFAIGLSSSTVPDVPDEFFIEPANGPTYVTAMLWSGEHIIDISAELVGDGTVFLDDTYQLTPDGSFEFFDVVYAPFFQLEMEELLPPGSEHSLTIDSPTWGQYTFTLNVPQAIELHPYDITGLNPGDQLEISWDWLTDSDSFAILDGSSIRYVEYDFGSGEVTDPSYQMTYQPDTTVVLGVLYDSIVYPDPEKNNTVATGLYQELVFEW